MEKVREFYEKGGEVSRLAQGLGLVEGWRTKELLGRFLKPGAVVYDIGGGAGYYADWLAMPLYHLQEKGDRLQALAEARRVLRPGGQLVAGAISKFSSTTWALSVYGSKNNYIDDPLYMGMLKGELTTGRHNKPGQFNCLCDAYFHTPEGFRSELEEAGFTVGSLYAIEGCAWLAPILEEKWADPASRENLLTLVRLTEQEPSLMGLSPHFCAIATAL